MAAAVSTPSVRRVSNRALKNESVASLIHLKQEMSHATSSASVSSLGDRQQRVVAAYSGNGHGQTGASATSKLNTGIQSSTKPEPMVHKNFVPAAPSTMPLAGNQKTTTAAPSSDTQYAVRRNSSRVGPMVSMSGPHISDLTSHHPHQQSSSSQQTVATPYQSSNHQSTYQQTGNHPQQPGNSAIIANSGYNIVASTANMIRRNSFGLLTGRGGASNNNNGNVERTPSDAVVSGADTRRHPHQQQQPPSSGSGSGVCDDGSAPALGSAPPLVRQSSTTRQMLNSIGNLITGGPTSSSSSGSAVAATASGSKRHSLRQVIPYEEPATPATVSSSLHTTSVAGGTTAGSAAKAGVTNNSSSVIPDPGPESSRPLSPNDVNQGTSTHRSAKSIIGRVSSAIGLKQQLQAQPVEGLAGNREQPQGTEAGDVPVTKPGKLCCDKCDGRHRTEDCPHYNKNREPHPDAQKNFYKKFGGSSNLPGAVIASATIVRQPGDGSCLFHSLSYGLKDGSSAASLRAEICQFIAKHPNFKISDTPLSDWVKWDSNVTCGEYARRMSNASVWGGGIEMACLSQIRNVNVHVYEANYGSSRDFGLGGSKFGGGGGGFKRISAFDVPVEPEKQRIIRVLYCGGVHYEALVVQ